MKADMERQESASDGASAGDGASIPLPVREPVTIGPIDENTRSDRLIAWSLERFAHLNLTITTSFGMEGCALIDMYAKHGKPMTIIYLDTMFFFLETYELRDRMIAKYPHLTFVNRGTDLTPEAQAAEYGDELWKHNPDMCCRLRKVDPMNRVMTGVDVWVTALRRTQSVTRANIKLVEWDWRYQVLKLNPLAAWERDQIWAYIQEHDVPYNTLHERDYPTVGCTHCTKPVPGSNPWDYSRSGRWSDMEKTECGLHGGEGI